MTERYLNTVVAQARQHIDAAASRIEDSAIIDAVNHVQMLYAKADVSFASSFNPRAAIQQGPVTVRQIAALYLYDNELYAIEGNGQMVKDALENAARFFQHLLDPSCARGPLINSAVIGYNFDIAQGVTYEIDVTRPMGDRIRNLEFRGKPLAPDQKLRFALNNYRAAGSNGYTMFQRCEGASGGPTKIFARLIMRYYSEHDSLRNPIITGVLCPKGTPDLCELKSRHDTRAADEIARHALASFTIDSPICGKQRTASRYRSNVSGFRMQQSGVTLNFSSIRSSIGDAVRMTTGRWRKFLIFSDLLQHFDAVDLGHREIEQGPYRERAASANSPCRRRYSSAELAISHHMKSVLQSIVF